MKGSEAVSFCCALLSGRGFIKEVYRAATEYHTCNDVDISTFTGFERALSKVQILPLTGKSLSTCDDVTGIHNIRCAVLARIGNCFACFDRSFSGVSPLEMFANVL